MRQPPGPLAYLARIAALVAAGDLVTKQLAASWVTDPFRPGSLLSLAVVYNDKSAFGISLGPYTWQVNLAITLLAMLLILPVCRDLARVDRHAPAGLGLILGGAIGNFSSLLLSPRGVVDFIAVRTGADTALVLNAADIAAYAGLAVLLRTAVRIVAEMRAQVGAELAGVAGRQVAHDMEIVRPVAFEGASPVWRPGAPALRLVTDSPPPAGRSDRRRSPIRPMSHPLPELSDRL